MPPHLFERRIHLITGKGGVGRTTLAAAMALAHARKGRRVLLAEVGDEKRGSSPLARMFGREEIDEKPTEVAHGVYAVQLSAIDGEEEKRLRLNLERYAGSGRVDRDLQVAHKLVIAQEALTKIEEVWAR